MTTEVAPGFVIWLTGLPASGKTTLARLLQEKLADRGSHTQLLDSDELRQQLTPEPTYSATERGWFYETVVYLAGLLAQNGVNVIIAATAPCRAPRELARQRLPVFAEVFVDCPVAVCQARDPKGLWQQASARQITALPGANAVYEPPLNPEVQVNTAQVSAETAVAHILHTLAKQGFWSDLF